ncbi:MAG: hypothetical protein UMR38_02525 [Candidatus Izemoplasma sp.]|nr:hypothetical protein [Candidatus Izemoplasma sp.]
MTSGEELMLLLELNNYDITKYRIKKFLEFDQDFHDVSLVNQRTLKDLLVTYYTYDSSKDARYKNPLAYQSSWPMQIDTIDKFYVSHVDLDKPMTLKAFIELDTFEPLTKESILYDIFDRWIEAYRNASIQQMEDLETLVELLPKKIKKQRKPSFLAFILTVLLGLFLALLYQSPESLTPAMFPFLEGMVRRLNGLLYEQPWYSLFGVVTIFLLFTHAIANVFFKRFIKDVRGEKSKYAKRMFTKWKDDMENARLKQSGILEDYVETVMKDPKQSGLDMAVLAGPEKLLDKFKNYVRSINNRFDKMTKYHKRFMRYLRILLFLSLLATIGFIAIGLTTQGGA